MSYLEHESHIDSVLSTEEIISTLNSADEIDSTLDKVVEVIKPYNSSENNDTITEVDNKNYTISVHIKNTWFNSIDDFPAQGSPNIIYGDKINKVLYIWNADTSSYELFMDEGKVKDILVNGESVLSSDDKIARITVPTSISELNDDIGLATREETNDLIQETRNETATLIKDSKDETATLIKAVREETAELIQNTQKSTENSIANLIGGASESLDTLKEIEDWIRNDETGTVDLIKRIDHLEDNKVDKIDGKGLSTNDYSNEEKQQLSELVDLVAEHDDAVNEFKNIYDSQSQTLNVASIKNVNDIQSNSITANNITINDTPIHDMVDSHIIEGVPYLAYTKAIMDYKIFGKSANENLLKQTFVMPSLNEVQSGQKDGEIKILDSNNEPYILNLAVGGTYVVEYLYQGEQGSVKATSVGVNGIVGLSLPIPITSSGNSVNISVFDNAQNLFGGDGAFTVIMCDDPTGIDLYSFPDNPLSITSIKQDLEISDVGPLVKDVDNLVNYYKKEEVYSQEQTYSKEETYSKTETETLINDLKNDETIVKTTSQLIINGGTSEV